MGRLLAVGALVLVAACSLSKADIPRVDSGTGPTDSGGIDAGPAIEACSRCDPIANTGCTVEAACYVNPFFADTDPGQCLPQGTERRGSVACATRPDRCEAGLYCLSAWGCLELCTSTEGCSGGQDCVTVPGGCVGFCGDACHVLGSDCPPDRPACDSVTGSPGGNTCRRVVGGGMAGTECEDPTECAAGFTCLAGPSLVGRCYPYFDCEVVPEAVCIVGVAMIGVDPDGTSVCTCNPE